MDKPRLLVSFSGGETSAYMTYLLLRECRDLFSDIAVVFANTGQENEATLEFVQRCDAEFGFGTVWVEAVVHEGRVGTTHRIVTFETASRDGEPFEAVIQKYGIPNQKYPHCTRELKLQPIWSYARSIGWPRRSYWTAVGIRADESGRAAKDAAENLILYPLCDLHPTTKPQVNLFWSKQAFRLNLTGYQGNCKWCWKKATRKLLTIVTETPAAFDFPERMEAAYGTIGPEFAKTTAPGYRRTFFRKNLSSQDIRHLAATTSWDRPEDDALAMPDGSTLPLDSDSGCVESCEVDFTEADTHAT